MFKGLNRELEKILEKKAKDPYWVKPDVTDAKLDLVLIKELNRESEKLYRKMEYQAFAEIAKEWIEFLVCLPVLPIIKIIKEIKSVD